MADRPPWNVLRATFYLLAGLIAVELLVTTWSAGICSWLILMDRLPIGGCSGVGATIRDIWSEALSALLALLLAARQGPPPHDPPQP